MPITTNCAETCPLVDFTIQTVGDRLTPDELMQYAVLAVTTDGMSQRAAAKKFGIAQKTLSRRLQEVSQVTHPETSQSTTKDSAIGTDQKAIGKLNSNQKRNALTKLCRQNDAPKIVFGTPSVMRGWLEWAGVSIPPELAGASTPFTPLQSTTPTQDNDQQEEEELQAHNHVSLVPDGAGQADPDDDFRNSDAIRDEVCKQVQDSDRPVDFKRAILLLAELDSICTEAWYRRHPEPWIADDWAHVNSELSAIHSLVRQRAQEECEDALSASNAIEVTATSVA